MKYISTEKLKAEITRLKGQLIRGACAAQIVMETNCKEEAYDDILSFLSDLESETTYDTRQYTPRPSVSIEDVARVQFGSHAKLFDHKRKAVFDWEQFKEVVGIFYGFGKKDTSDTLESKKLMGQDRLEDEIERCVIDPYYDLDGVAVKGATAYITVNDVADIARYFAQWGAEHLKKQMMKEEEK